jgi:hypothetical protein
MVKNEPLMNADERRWAGSARSRATLFCLRRMLLCDAGGFAC